METEKMTLEQIEQQLLQVMRETEFFSLNVGKDDITPETSIIKDLALDSIQLLEYLVAVENSLKENMDYQDLSIDVFKNFHTLAEYFYGKIKQVREC